MIRIRY